MQILYNVLMRRSIFLVLLFCSSLSFVFAEYREIKTTYFTIVYDDAVSAQSAYMLAKNADAIAEELFAYHSVKPFKSRFPVFLKPYEESLNGYYTGSPYDHVVIYDTLPTDNIISNNSESLLSVFKHELTHVVTMKRFFAFTYSMPISEGVAVLAESSDGEGRLNDPRVWEELMQDKYDGIAWSWNDLERRDTYPSGLFGYLYGGAFSQFLTKVYGDEVYAKFLRMHPKWFTTRNFKLAFGKSITELFNAFLDTIPLPENCFEPEQLIKKRSLYSALASDNNTVFYADNNEGTIFSLDVKTKKIKKLFNINNSVYNLSISSTGILAVSYFYSEHGSSLSKVILYDVHNQKILSDQYSSLRYASISPDEKNICGVRVVGQTAELVLIDRKTKTEKILYTAQPGGEYTNIYQVAAIDNMRYAAIFSHGIYRDIVLVSSDGTIQKLELPFKSKAVGEVSILPQSNFVVFSYYPDNEVSFARLATWNFDTNEVNVLSADVSGGAHNPVALYDAEKDLFNFAVVSSHSEYNLLSCIDSSYLKNAGKTHLSSLYSEDIPDEFFVSKKYNPIMKMWIPSVMPWLSLGTDFKNTSYGLTFSSQDLIGRLSYSFTLGIMPIPTFAQLDFLGNLHLGSNTLSFNVFDRAIISSPARGTHSTGFGFSNTYLFMPGINQVRLALSTSIFSTWYSVFNTSHSPYRQAYNAGVLQVGQTLSITSAKRRERLGAQFFALDTFGVNNKIQVACAFNYQTKETGLVIQDSFTAMLPVVPLTLKTSLAYTYSSVFSPLSAVYVLQNSIGAVAPSYLPSMSEHDDYYTSVTPTGKNHLYVGLDGSLRIFSVEIQKGSSWLPICYNRINWDIGGKLVASVLRDPSPYILSSVYTTISIEVSGAAEIGVKYAHPIVRGAKLGKFELILKLDI